MACGQLPPTLQKCSLRMVGEGTMRTARIWSRVFVDCMFGVFVLCNLFPCDPCSRETFCPVYLFVLFLVLSVLCVSWLCPFCAFLALLSFVRFVLFLVLSVLCISWLCPFCAFLALTKGSN